jgi:hypothetical protein
MKIQKSLKVLALALITSGIAMTSFAATLLPGEDQAKAKEELSHGNVACLVVTAGKPNLEWVTETACKAIPKATVIPQSDIGKVQAVIYKQQNQTAPSVKATPTQPTVTAPVSKKGCKYGNSNTGYTTDYTLAIASPQCQQLIKSGNNPCIVDGNYDATIEAGTAACDALIKSTAQAKAAGICKVGDMGYPTIAQGTAACTALQSKYHAQQVQAAKLAAENTAKIAHNPVYCLFSDYHIDTYASAKDCKDDGGTAISAAQAQQVKLEISTRKVYCLARDNNDIESLSVIPISQCLQVHGQQLSPGSTNFAQVRNEMAIHNENVRAAEAKAKKTAAQQKAASPALDK